MAGILVLDPRRVAVAPESDEVTVTARIRNTGAVVDQFSLEVLGPVAAWAELEPRGISLFPGAEGDVTIRFKPPLSVAAAAGDQHFGVRLRSAIDPGDSVVEEATAVVTPVVRVQPRLVPRASKGRLKGKHRVRIKNLGNTPATVALAASDPDELINFKLASRSVSVAAGATGEVRLKAKARGSKLVGKVEPKPFVVSVVPQGGEPEQLNGIYRQRAFVGGWVLPILALLLAAVIAVAVLHNSSSGPAQQTLAPAATPTPAPTPAPTPTPAATPAPGSGTTPAGGTNPGAGTGSAPGTQPGTSASTSASGPTPQPIKPIPLGTPPPH